ncbi:MAG: DUF1016 family protein [Cytophagales bacterium]|nr:MAG: DUF1016 family protein [Cytophagales bacterium]
MNDLIQNQDYQDLLKKLGDTYLTGRKRVLQAINSEVLLTYWEMGRYIVEYEQKGKIKAEYGKKILIQLAKDLKIQYDKGFSRSYLVYIRLFYIRYPKSETLFHQLSWSHYFEILKIDDEFERSFYEKQAILEKWSIQELRRQKKTALFARLALSKDKQGILDMAKEGFVPNQENDIIKDPFVFDFLGIELPQKLKEKDLEKKLMEHLQIFLLELGKGFTFVGRQYRIVVDNTEYFVDLVFYHRILRCFVLIDLKINEVKHYDVGQMNFYLNYFSVEENIEGDNEPIRIILTTEKNNVAIEYALRGITNRLLVAKYQLYLPDKELLMQKVREILET